MTQAVAPTIIDIVNGQELILKPSPNLAIPIEVIPAALAKYIADALGRLPVSVKTAEDAETVSEVINHASKAIKSLEERVTELRRPFTDEANRISASAKPVIDSTRAILNGQGLQLKAWESEQKRLADLALAEQRRKEAEARAKAEAEEREKARFLAEAKAAVEAAQREEERLKWQAEEEERRAAVHMAEGRTDEAFDATAAGLAKASEIQAQADAAAIKRMEAKNLQKQIEAMPVAAPVVVPVAAPVVVPKLKGVKSKKSVKWIEPVDVMQLDAAYHLPNLALIERNILAGVIKKGPGVDFEIEETFGGSGR